MGFLTIFDSKNTQKKATPSFATPAFATVFFGPHRLFGLGLKFNLALSCYISIPYHVLSFLKYSTHFLALA